MKCWAESVSDCCDTQSREHYITKGLFSGKMLKISGFPFLNEDEKEVSKESLTKKCLCKKHNELLSPFDTESIKFAKSIEYAHRLSLVRRHSKAKRFSVHNKSVDLELFSRWIIKTYIGVLDFFPGESEISTDTLASWVYSTCKLEKFIDYEFSMKEGDDFVVSEKVEVAPLMMGDYSVGLSFVIYGVRIKARFYKEPVGNLKRPKLKFTEYRQGLSCVVQFK